MSPVSKISPQLQILSDSDPRDTKHPVAKYSVANGSQALTAIILGEVGGTAWDFLGNYG